MIFDLIKNKPYGIVKEYRNVIPRIIDGKFYWFEKFTIVKELRKEMFGNYYFYVTLIDCPTKIFYHRVGSLEQDEIRYIKTSNIFKYVKK